MNGSKLLALFSLVVAPALAGEEINEILQTGEYVGDRNPLFDVGIDGSGNGRPGTVPQRLVLIGSGIQLDAGDLAHSRDTPGVAGPAHRKVHAYETTNAFGGAGDLEGCDGETGFTFGHLAAATALGNASNVPAGYGAGWEPFLSRRLDGVAPGARLVAFDADAGGCADPMADTLLPGDLYFQALPEMSSLGRGREVHDGRTFLLTFGATANVYNVTALDSDRFLHDHPEVSMVAPVGNGGPDPGIISDTGTIKNAIVVGATYARDVGVCGGFPLVACDEIPLDPDCPGVPNCIALSGAGRDARWQGSGVGPALPGAANRVAPILMAPGADARIGDDALEPYSCGTDDDDGNGPVECDGVEGPSGTEIAAAATSGAVLLVRDYFQQGFYPDGYPVLANREPLVSGALIKALLVASAEWMAIAGLEDAPGLSVGYRFNNEQGYGRIRLSNVLKLSEASAGLAGLIVHDGLAGDDDVSDLDLPPGVEPGEIVSAPVVVLDDEQELRVALAWTDGFAFSGGLTRNLDLLLTSPSGVVYQGNYFTDDGNRNGALDPGEDCPPIGADAPDGVINEGRWSLPRCPSSSVEGAGGQAVPFDNANVVEAIFLSPDPDGNGNLRDGVCAPESGSPGGVDGDGACGHPSDCALQPAAPAPSDRCVGGTNQVEPGEWLVEIRAGTPFPMGAPQDFSLVVAGGAIASSTVLWAADEPDCEDPIGLEVLEVTAPFDPLDPGTVGGRLRVQVLDPDDGTVLDEEIGFAVVEPSPGLPRFVSDPPLPLLPSLAPTAGNGWIEAYDGHVLRAIYDDLDGEKRALSRLSCGAALPVPGEPGGLEIATAEETEDGLELSIEYAPACMGADHSVVYGRLDAVSLHDYTGQVCGLGVDGEAHVVLPEAEPGISYFLLVVANDGVDTEGSYGRDGGGQERPERLDGDPACPLVQELPAQCR